ncbi:hypothetical protein ACFX2C_028659 [Malus domestica]
MCCIFSTTSSKVFVVGHSRGTIMSLAALTQPDIAELVEAAALFCPISYLEHITSKFALRMVIIYNDQPKKDRKATMEMKKIACAVLFAAASVSSVMAHAGHAHAPAPGPGAAPSDASASLPVLGSVVGASVVSFIAYYMH